MNLIESGLWVYLALLGFIWLFYLLVKLIRNFRAKSILQESISSGLHEPVSLHPVIDPVLCRGSGACVSACPEFHVLGMINNRAKLIDPQSCIGHGACVTACPFDAISLVFGSAKRGVDIPVVSPDFETSVPGIFIAGELGGMGLIRNAITQGKEAMDAIERFRSKDNDFDVVIVGAGPAGLSASLGAVEKNLRYLTLDQDSLGGAVFKYPRRKLVMTSPVKLPLVGQVKMRETSKEDLLELWEKIEKDYNLQINYQEKVSAINKSKQGFQIKTNKASYSANAVLLCIGRRGTPRKLNVAGENQSKVVYQLIDSEQYREQKVLIVGGGDSALEAATSIAEENGTTVTLSYRNKAFNRAKKKNQDKVIKALKKGRLNLLLQSTVQSISKSHVVLDHDDEEIEIENDAVIICVGGILPAAFLNETGVEVETKFGTA